MAKNPKDGNLIYHLTSVDNLESIFQNGLLSRDEVGDFDDVADEEIIEHRKRKGLNNLVPFHFFGANPFDGSVQLGHPDKKFVFITLQRKYARSNGFKILPKHPLSLDDCSLLSYDEGIVRIDWDKMAIRDYSDNECKEICMAECLTANRVDPKDFFAIYVPDEETKASVIALRDRIIGSTNSFYVDILSYIFVQ